MSANLWPASPAKILGWLILGLLLSASWASADSSALEKVKQAIGSLAMPIEHKEAARTEAKDGKPPFQGESWIFDCGGAKPEIHYGRFLNRPPDYTGQHPSLINGDMGIGFGNQTMNDAFRYWYGGSTIRVLLDHQDIMVQRPAAKIEFSSDEQGYLQFAWDLENGNLLRLTFAVPSDGHAIYAQVELQGPTAAQAFKEALELQIICYPGGFGPAYKVPSDRCVQTANNYGEVPMNFAAKDNPTVPITADDHWIYYLDKLVDYGSLGLLFIPAEKLTGEVKMSNYGQMTILKYPASTTSCRLAFYAYDIETVNAFRMFTRQCDQELAALKTMRFWLEGE